MNRRYTAALIVLYIVFVLYIIWTTNYRYPLA